VMLMPDSVEGYRYNRMMTQGFSDSVISRVDLSRANVSVPDSWVPYINTLDSRLSNLCPDYKISQIKEKFGKLRFYCEGVSEEGQLVINSYEMVSDFWGGE